MGNIKRSQTIHIGTKITSGTDVNTPITWPHDGVKKSSSYSYVITSIDTYGNESNFSSIKTFIAGDTTPPGPITATTKINGYKSIEYQWTNPSDVDFNGCKIYNDLAKTSLLNELGGRTPGSKVSWTYITSTVNETKSVYISTFDHNRNESVTPVKITGVSQRPTNTTDTMTLSIIDTNGIEYQSDAFLSSAAGITYRVKIICSTALTFDATYRLFVYDASGALFISETPISDGGASNNRRYRSSNMVFTGITEGRGAAVVKGLDPSGSIVSGSLTLYMDRTKPTISTMSIDAGATITNDRAVDVALSYSDSGSGVDAVQVSTALSPILGNWVGISTPTGTIRVPYNLPNVEKTYTLYGWVKDRAGNISNRKTSDNNTYYRKLKDDPTGGLTFYKTDGITPLAANKNGWFKENVRVQYSAAVPSGSTANISNIYYRTNVNDGGWGAWTNNIIAPPDPAPAVTLDITTEATGPSKGVYIEFYSVNKLGLTGGNAQSYIRIDKTSPTLSKTVFWQTSNCRSLNRESVLWWNESAGSDTISGIQNTYIYRASTNSWPNAHTVNAVVNGQNWMIDDEDKLETGKTYYYWGRVADNADNLSATSNVLSLKATYDWEYEYRNWVSNGSFERISTAGGYTKANDWFRGPDLLGTSNVVYLESYHGIYALKCSGPTTNENYTYIHIPDDNRIFTLSFYAKKKAGSTWNNTFRVSLGWTQPDSTFISSQNITVSSSAGWNRSSYTLSKGSGATYTIPSNAAILKLAFQSVDFTGSDFILVDGVQWEDGSTATRFNDNQVITAQRINAGVIDANHIRAGVINATLIKAGAIVATAIAANAVTATKILAGSIDSTKIVTEGLHVKSSGGMSMITVGASSDPTNQSYTVLKPDSMYYHPRGYGASEKWHFMKHFEHEQHIEINKFFNFKRRFIAPDGSPFTPEYDVSLSMWYDSDSNVIAENRYNIIMGYATASQIRANVIRYDPGPNFMYRVTDQFTKTVNYNIPVTYDLSSSTYTAITTCMAACGWVNYSIPWPGPIGTLQRVSWRIEGSHDNSTWVGTTYYQKIYDGAATTIPYRQTFCHKNLYKPTNRVGMRYYKITFYGNNNGPASFTWTQFQWFPYISGNDWEFIEGTSGAGITHQPYFGSYKAWDGFLNY